MVKLVLTTILAAAWLLESCGSPDGNAADTELSTGCTSATAGLAQPASAPTTVRVGVTGALAEAAQYLADGEGYFAREGLKAQLINFTSPTRMIPALASGQLDVASGNIGPGLFRASENNLCVKIVGSLARHEVTGNGVFLFARSDLVHDGKLNDYAGLKGLHVALSARDSSGEYALAKLLAAGGLSLSDVRVVQMSFPTILVSLANKSIDAAVLPEALASAAADKNLGVKWKPVADVLPGAQFGVVLFSPEFAGRRDVATRWMAAYLQAARDYDAAFFHNIRRDAVVDQLVKASPMKDPHLYGEMGFPVIDPNGIVNVASIEDQMRWLVNAGELREPMDLAQLVDASFAQSAVNRLGTYR